jgi:hypothetical protein
LVISSIAFTVVTKSESVTGVCTSKQIDPEQYGAD